MVKQDVTEHTHRTIIPNAAQTANGIDADRGSFVFQRRYQQGGSRLPLVPADRNGGIASYKPVLVLDKHPSEALDAFVVAR